MLRRAIIWVHRYAGIALGVLVVLATVTGSFTVFAPEIDRWLNPELYRVSEGSRVEGGNLERFYRQAVAAYPDQPADFRPAFVNMRLPLDEDDSVYVLMIDSFSEPHGPWWEVFGDAGTGEIIGARESGDSFAGLLLASHIGLFLGEHSLGTTLIGIGGILLIGFIVTGLYLWWPGLRRLSTGFKVARHQGPRKFWLDLHQVSGVLIAVPLLVITITGLFYVWPGQTRVPLERMFTIPDRISSPASLPSGSAPIGIDRALELASGAFPEATPTVIIVPTGPQGAYQIRKRFEGDMQRQYLNGNALVWIDQYSGEVLQTHDARQTPALTRIFHDWQLPLHGGEIAGLLGRIIAFLAGLLPLGMFITGIYCWLKARSRRQSASQQ